MLGGSKATGRKRPIWCRLNNVRRLCCQILCTRIVDTVVLVVERKPEAAQASNLERDLRWALLAAQLLMLRGRVQERKEGSAKTVRSDILTRLACSGALAMVSMVS